VAHEIVSVSRFVVSGYSLFVVVPQLDRRASAGPSDAALVVSAKAGERWAMEALFRRHASLVNGMAFRLMGRDADVDDLVQEAFVQAMGSLGRLENPEAFGSWLAAIVARQAYKLIRRRHLLGRLGLRQPEPVDLDSLVSATAPPDAQCELRAVYSRIHEMPAGLRVPLVLCRVEGLKREVAAEMLGLSLGTLKRRLAEADRELERSV
jgi:RNA polymerase sigma-70 factor, ECF subfamily